MKPNRSYFLQTREHLSKAQRGLVGDGISEVMTKLKETSSDGTSYSGDLLAIVDVLKNMTEIFRRSYYSPSSTDMRVIHFLEYSFFIFLFKCSVAYCSGRRKGPGLYVSLHPNEMWEFIHVVMQLSILQMYNVRITAVYFVGEQ